MPTISPQVRPSIGGTSDAVYPRASVKASTGMNMPESAPAQTPVETMGQPVISEETQKVRLSPQLTAIARKEQKLQAEIEALRQKEAEIERMKSDFVPKTSFKEKLQKNAVEALGELGLTYDDLVNQVLTQSQSADPIAQLKSEIDQLKQSQKDTVDRQYEATLKQYRAEADRLLESNPKDFALTRTQEASDAIVEWIVTNFEEDGTVIPIEQAARDVEGYLRDQARKMASALRETEPVQEATPKKLPPPQTTLKTLTNMVETSPSRQTGQFQHLSPKERLAQAIARAQQG